MFLGCKVSVSTLEKERDGLNKRISYSVQFIPNTTTQSVMAFGTDSRLYRG